MEIALTNYLKKIEEEYGKARKEFNALADKLADEETRYNSLNWINYSPEGKTNEHNKYEETKKAIQSEILAVRDNFSKAVDRIRMDADKVFDRRFNYTSDDVDMKGIELLKSKIGVDGIIKVAEEYKNKGNMTMYFICADKLQDVEIPPMAISTNPGAPNNRAKAYYERVQVDKKRVDHDVLDGFIGICLAGLRENISLANGVDKIHADEYTRYEKAADSIIVKASTPWD